jgi:hypothetical protein
MPNWKKVIVSGSSAHLNQITGSGGIHLPDSAKLTLGDAQDLKIYHGGSNSIIQEGGAGGLIIRASTLTLLADNTSENFIVATENAGVDIYYNGSKKLETIHTGVDVTGAITASGDISGSSTSILTMSEISSSGDIVASGDVVAYYTSDIRLKDNVEVIKGSLDKIDGIRGVEFDWNEDSPGWARERGHDVGVIAQEVQKVLPEVVQERKNGYLGVDYKRIVPLLIESVKELKQEIEDLKKKVN